MPDDPVPAGPDVDAETIEDLWWFAYWSAVLSDQGNTPTEVADLIAAHATTAAIELAADDAQR